MHSKQVAEEIIEIPSNPFVLSAEKIEELRAELFPEGAIEVIIHCCIVFFRSVYCFFLLFCIASNGCVVVAVLYARAFFVFFCSMLMRVHTFIEIIYTSIHRFSTRS
jgi:hypothetical protein